MKVLNLPAKFSNHLQSQPEYGMGYQKVKVFLTNGQVIEGVVQNCDLLVYPEHVPDIEPEKILDVMNIPRDTNYNTFHILDA